MIGRFLLVALTCIEIGFSLAQGPGNPPQKPPAGYELYSWQDPNGSWDFCLLPSPSGVNIRAEEVFNRKSLLRGMGQLNREISKLPIGATIYWLDGIVGDTGYKAKQSHSLSYPPAYIVERVRRYAEKRHVEVQLEKESGAVIDPAESRLS